MFIVLKHECSVEVYDFPSMNVHCNVSLLVCVYDFVVSHTLKKPFYDGYQNFTVIVCRIPLYLNFTLF